MKFTDKISAFQARRRDKMVTSLSHCFQGYRLVKYYHPLRGTHREPFPTGVARKWLLVVK